MSVRFAIRADGSNTIGLGHVMRCAALVRAMAAAGSPPVWFTTTPQHLPTDLGPGTEVCPLPDDAALPDAMAARGLHHLVADWKVSEPARVAALRASGVHVTMVGNFLHGAVPDLHVRQGFLPALSPSGAPALSGPKYLLLSEAYAELPAREVRPEARRILLSLGGTVTPLLDRIRACLAEHFGDCEVEGRGPAGDQPLPPLDTALRAADIGILAGGTSLHEAAATGLPTICVPIAPNQLDRAEQFESTGLGLALDPNDPGFEARLSQALTALIADTERRARMARTGQALVDGHGAGRVARHLLSLTATPQAESQ